MTSENGPGGTSLTVALVTPWKRKGGIGSYATRFADALCNRGIAVEPVPVPASQPANPFAFSDLVDVIPVGADFVHVQFEAGLFGQLGMTGVGAPWFFHRLADDPRPVVTTLHEVHAAHDHRGPVGDWLLRRRDWAIERAAFRASDSVVVHTREAARVLRSRHGTARRIERMLLPAGTGHTPAPAVDARAGFGLESPVLLTFGWVEEKKRFAEVIRTLPDLPGVTYHVVGDPRPDQPDAFVPARRLAERLGVADRVVRSGYVGEEGFADVFGAADAVVLPYGRVSVSIAVNDALSYRRPVVASSLPYFDELRDRYGCLLTYDSQTELVDVLRRVLYDDRTRSELTAATERYVSEVNWTTFAERTERLYRDRQEST